MRYLGLVVGLAAALPACTEIPDCLRGDDAAPVVIMAGQWAQGSPGTQAAPLAESGGAGAAGAESSMPVARPVVVPVPAAPVAAYAGGAGVSASPSRLRASISTPY